MHERVPDWPASSLPESASAAQTGASLTAVTVIDIATGVEGALPSVARNVKLSEPL